MLIMRGLSMSRPIGSVMDQTTKVNDPKKLRVQEASGDVIKHQI